MGDTLGFATREEGVNTHNGVVAVLKLHDAAVDAGHLGGVDHLLVGGGGAGQPDVVADADLQHLHILQDDADGVVEGVGGHVTQVYATDADGTAGDVAEPRQ